MDESQIKMHVLPRIAAQQYRVKTWRSHGRPWRLKSVEGDQKLRFDRPKGDYDLRSTKRVAITIE